MTGRADIYDSVSSRFISTGQSSDYALKLAPNQVAVLVFTPPGGNTTTNGSRLMVDGVVVEYRKL